MNEALDRRAARRAADQAKKRTAVLDAVVEAFNQRHPVGCTVRIYDKPAPGSVKPAAFRGTGVKLTVIAPGAHIDGESVVVAVEGRDRELVDIKRVKWNAA
jgi:hypothetical protein